MVSLETKMERFPLTVYYPEGGPHAILIVHTENEQNQFLMAKLGDREVEDVLAPLLAMKLKKEGRALAVRKLWLADIVAPPRALQERFALQSYDAAVSAFKQEVIFMALDYVKGDRPLPKGIVRCAEYDPDPIYFINDETRYRCPSCHCESLYHELAEDEHGNPACPAFPLGDPHPQCLRTDLTPLGPTHFEPDDYAKRNHSSCRRCHGDVFVFQLDFEAFYESKRHFIEEIHAKRNQPFPGTKPAPRPTPVRSRAHEADPERPLYMGMPRHGHHSKGNVMEPVDLTDEHLPYTHGYEQPLFFCHGAPADVPRWVEAIMFRWKQDEEAASRIARRHHHEREKRERDAKAALFLSIMEGV